MKDHLPDTFRLNGVTYVAVNALCTEPGQTYHGFLPLPDHPLPGMVIEFCRDGVQHTLRWSPEVLERGNRTELGLGPWPCQGFWKCDRLRIMAGYGNGESDRWRMRVGGAVPVEAPDPVAVAGALRLLGEVAQLEGYTDLLHRIDAFLSTQAKP